MDNKRVEFLSGEAGCMIMAAAMSLGGLRV